MRHKCAHCGGRHFGLIRYRYFALQFCRAKCKAAYLRAIKEKARERRRWLKFLAG